MANPTTPHDQASSGPKWSSKFAFLMAAIGVAVGLGNLWRFPFQTGANGGSAFVIIYLVCVALIAWPILMGEIAIGRRKGLSAVGSPRELAKDVGASPMWGVIGIVAIVANMFILTTYCFIAGQVMSYSVMAFMGVFANHDPAATLPLFHGTILPVVWFTGFLVLTMLVVARGLHGGIERIVTTLMPVFFVLLVGLSIFALSIGAADKAFAYLFTPRFDLVTPSTVLAALGQAFFSIAIGAGAMITYGAYLERKENIPANAGIIACADTLVAIIAGLMIFPVVFAFGLDPAAGMGLIFEALPVTFSGMSGGAIIGGLFFFLAFIAALTSSISMLMIPAVVFEEWRGWSRRQSVMILGGIVWLVGVSSTQIPHLAENIDFVVGNILLPLGGLLGALFVGWVVPREIMRDEFHNASDRLFGVWRFLIRYLAPIAVGSILVFGLMG
ncbi:MAG: sodium-dependent transporter [Hyphococcus sp.]|nr:MAG: sodium-dependent transporter [Marinicaulis sp.]